MKHLRLKILATLSLVSLLICGCSLAESGQLNFPNPRIVSAKDVPRIIKSIPSYTKFDYSGLSSFNGKLYASSNIGLLEYEGGTLSRLYKWYDRDDVISGPWLDRANQSLWVFHNGINKLIRFDGKNWKAMDLPRPEEGYTRGDMLRGFQGVSTDNTFWLQGGNHAWRWDASKDVWVSESVPDTGSFVSIAPIKDKIFVIMRHEDIPSYAQTPSSKPDKNSDAVYFLENGKWQEIPNKLGTKFFTKDVAIAKEVAYISTMDGKLLRLTSSEIVQIESLGEVEAMTVTSSGNLLASFRNNGIYEYSDGWRKKFSSPYPSTEAEHWTHLSENNGQIALTITSKPQMTGEDKWKYPGQTTLWISNGSELKAIPLGER